MDWEIKDATSIAGTGWDLLSINGTLAINATSGNKFTIDISTLTLANVAGNAANFNNATGYTWTIATTTGGITGFDASAPKLPRPSTAVPFEITATKLPRAVCNPPGP